MSDDFAFGRSNVVVGPAASGKSTIARQLAEMLSLPVVELDALYWEPGWVASAEEEFRKKVASVAAWDSWVVDGHYERIWPELWPHAQAVIWLDLPLRTLLVRGFLRSWHRWRRQEVLWGTNRESVWAQLKFWDADRSLPGWLLRSHKARRRAYIAATVDRRWAHIRFMRI